MNFPDPESEEFRNKLNNSKRERFLWLAANNPSGCLIMMLAAGLVIVVIATLVKG